MSLTGCCVWGHCLDWGKGRKPWRLAFGSAYLNHGRARRSWLDLLYFVFMKEWHEALSRCAASLCVGVTGEGKGWVMFPKIPSVFLLDMTRVFQGSVTCVWTN